jgi:hypothetical protein
VLLSRAPLSVRRHSVRLACIRHAASVRPEPGSNSSYCGWNDLSRPSHKNPHGSSSRFSCKSSRQVRQTKNQMKFWLHLATFPTSGWRVSLSVDSLVGSAVLARPRDCSKRFDFCQIVCFGSGGRIRTIDLRVMSPTSCHCSTPRQLVSTTIAIRF